MNIYPVHIHAYIYRERDRERYIYIYLYVYTNLPVSDIVGLPHPRSGDSHGQETFLAPSADKQTCNYDTECSNHYMYTYIHMHLYTHFFLKQHFFKQPHCCSIFSWIELQMLPKCCLIHIIIVILRQILYLVYFIFMSRTRSLYVASMWSISHFNPHFHCH